MNWITLKSRPSSVVTGNKKNRSRHAPEHAMAIEDLNRLQVEGYLTAPVDRDEAIMADLRSGEVEHALEGNEQ
jgi:hypothetical protein